MTETFRWARLAELTGQEVHDLLRLRQDVFVVEQACAFAEIDGRDPEAEHLLVLWDGTLAGCLRLLSQDEPRIGRIVVAPAARGSGLGHRLMRAGLARCGDRRPGAAIHLSAQAHLQGFYARHGFIPVGETYLEDGIPHVDMRRPAA